MGPTKGGKSPKQAGKGVLERASIWAVGSQYSLEAWGVRRKSRGQQGLRYGARRGQKIPKTSWMWMHPHGCDVTQVGPPMTTAQFPVSEGSLTSLILLIARCCSHLTLTVLDILVGGTAGEVDSEEHTFLSATIQPLLAFINLEYLQVESAVVLHLDKDSVVKMAITWSRMTSLILCRGGIDSDSQLVQTALKQLYVIDVSIGFSFLVAAFAAFIFPALTHIRTRRTYDDDMNVPRWREVERLLAVMRAED
ncbi:hypothetical protein DFH09DRAFT_1087880 [Mycena vulgaris]|nr:hypothetical protein DFH09DRAFT_1087880 [Mycena vulgaris]